MQIPNFPVDPDISIDDKLLGSDAENNFKTKNFPLGTIFTLFKSILDETDEGQVRLGDGTYTEVVGTGIISDPYRINVVGLDEDTAITAGDNITVTGTGTNADPFVITGDDPPDATLINAGSNIAVTGTGTNADPYIIANTLAEITAQPSTLLGRSTAGVGEPESLTAAQVLTLLDAETATQLNARDTANRDRANHTGTQTAATISDLIATVDGRTGYNNTNWDTASNKSVQTLGFNTLNGTLSIGLNDSTTYDQILDGRYLQTVTQGTGISVDLTDPTAPVISLSGSATNTFENYFNNTFYDVGGDTLVGTIDGTNTLFTASQGEYRAGTAKVYVNGSLVFDGAGMTETDDTAGTVTLDTAPAANDDVLFEYEVGDFNSGQAGTGDMLAANNLSEVNPATSRVNLGLGAVAVLNEIGATNIADGSVTNPKLATMAANTVKGRSTNNGPVQDLTAAQLRTLTQTESVTELLLRDNANRDRANHTGVQAISTVTDLQNQLDGKLATGAKAADAELLDGLNSDQFVRGDVDAVVSGALTLDGGVIPLRLKGVGTGIGNASFITWEEPDGTRQGFIGFSSSLHSDLTLRNDTSARSLTLDDGGNLIYTGDMVADAFNVSSDKRLKENIVPVHGSYDIDFVSYTMKENPTQKRVGVIAQEVEKKYPEFVRETKGMKSVSYIDLLCAKVSELTKRVGELEANLNA